MTPAAKRVPVFLQLRLVPWCRQWLRDISWPAHFTPLSTISVTLLASQYHVSWGARETGWVAGPAAAGDAAHACPSCSPRPATARPCPRAQAAHGALSRSTGQPQPIAPIQLLSRWGSAGACARLGVTWGLPAGTYRHRVQGVAPAELATGHHRLLGGPAIAAHRAPLTASLHLHAALERCPPAGEADLQGSPGPVSGHPAPHRPPPWPCPVPDPVPVPVPIPAERWWRQRAALAKLALAPTCKPWLANPSPSWRQATIASSVPQPSPQTRPQRGWSPSPAPTATSTRPSKRLRPPLSRICGERQWQHHHHHHHQRCSRRRLCSAGWPCPARPAVAAAAPSPARPGLCCGAQMGPGPGASGHTGRWQPGTKRSQAQLWSAGSSPKLAGLGPGNCL